MDKPSEKRKDHKDYDDDDIGVQDYKAGGKREQLDGLWKYASKEVVGLPESRLVTNCYSKEHEGKENKKSDLLDGIIDGGPPILNVSKPKRVF